MVLLYFIGIGDPKYMPVPDWPSLNKLLLEALDNYNELNAAMNLVLFEDAMEHICRISRILESPRGNALLVGVGGKFMADVYLVLEAHGSCKLSMLQFIRYKFLSLAF